MTAEQLTVIALARAQEFTGHVPQNRALAYYRIGKRQQELFAMAAKINSEYFGVCASGNLSGGALDLTDTTDPVPAIEQLDRIEVLNPGTHETLVAGDEINPVPLNDQGIAFPPRVTIRDRVIRAVGTDLDGVTSIRVYYSKVPLALNHEDADTALELPEQFQGLLVVDLARDMVRRAKGIEPVQKAPWIAQLSEEEKPELDSFLEHVQSYATTLNARFTRDGAK